MSIDEIKRLLNKELKDMIEFKAALLIQKNVKMFMAIRERRRRKVAKNKIKIAVRCISKCWRTFQYKKYFDKMKHPAATIV